jgi:hypothetical protein
MSVETIAFFGMARASAASAWRGPMRFFSFGEGHCASSCAHASFSFCTSASRALLGAILPIALSRLNNSIAASRASPQMPIDTFFTNPSMRGSASIWMILAFLGQ